MWETIHPLSYLYKDVSIVRFPLEVIFIPKFILVSWVYVSLYILIYLSGCSGLKYISMQMYHDLMSEMTLLTRSFMVVKSDVGVLTYPG